MAGHNSRYKTLLNSSDFPSVVRRLHFTGSKLTIICSLMTTLKTCIRTITYLSDIGCLEIHGASLVFVLLPTSSMTLKHLISK